MARLKIGAKVKTRPNRLSEGWNRRSSLFIGRQSGSLETSLPTMILMGCVMKLSTRMGQLGRMIHRS